MEKMLTPVLPSISGDPSRRVGGTGIRRGPLQTPVFEEYLYELQGQRGRNILYEMSVNSPVAGAMLHAIRSLMRRAPLIVEARGMAPRYEAAKEFALDNLSPIIVSRMVDAASYMLVYGFNVQEIILRRDRRGRYVLDRLAPRAARSISDWVYDEEQDKVVGFVQTTSSGTAVSVPLSRCLHFRTTRGDTETPEGVSILRAGYSSYYYTKNLASIEAIGIERDLSGLPVLRIPGEMLDPNATPDQRAALATYERLIEDIRRDASEGIIIPSDRTDDGHPFFDVSLLAVAGNRQVNVSQTIERYEKRIAQTALAEFLFLGTGSGGSGSYALSSDKTRLFALSLTALLAEIAEQVETVLLPYLWAANGMNPDLIPQVRFGAVATPSIDEVSMFVERLTRSGFNFTDRETQNKLREMATLDDAPLEPDEVPVPESPLLRQSAEPPAAAATADEDGDDEGGDDEGGDDSRVVDIRSALMKGFASQ